MDLPFVRAESVTGVLIMCFMITSFSIIEAECTGHVIQPRGWVKNYQLSQGREKGEVHLHIIDFETGILHINHKMIKEVLGPDPRYSRIK